METPKLPLVTIVLPCFNEGGVLVNNFAEIAAHLKSLEPRYRFEVLVINDGSADNTAELANTLASAHAQVRTIHHPVNFGLGQAFRTAFAASRGDFVVTLDVDLSYSPDHIGRLLDVITAQKAKLVLASAYMPGGQVTNVPPLRRTLSIWGNRFLRTFSRGNLSTLTCMVRAYDGPFMRTLVLRSIGMEIMPEIVYKTMVMRGRIVEIPAHLDWSRQVQAGATRVSSMRILRHVFSTVVSGFMFRPFAFMMVPGFALLAISVYTNFWVFWAFFSAFALGAHSLSDAVRYVYTEHPHTLFVGTLSLVLAISLIGLGLIAMQTKRYFEDTYHLGVTLRASLLGEIDNPHR